MAVIAGLFLAFWIALGYGAWTARTLEIYAQKLLYAPLALAGWLAYRLVLPRIFTSRAQIERNVPAGRAALAGAAVGIALTIPVLLFSQLAPADAWKPGRMTDAPLILLLGLAVPVLEELLYRDGLQRFLTDRLGGQMSGHGGAMAAIALTSTFFGLVHAFPASLYIGACGAAFGVLYWRYGLISAILAHAVYNLGLLLAPWVFH